MFFKKFHLLFILVCGTASAQYIATDETRTPLQLIEDVLINSGCASVSNVSVSGGNFGSGENSWGYFNANGSGFPFSEGVVLSTGKIINTVGPNTFISDDGGGMGWTGDSDLNQALGLTSTFNATILEFDFIPVGNQISFDYIFSSEQYLTNPNPNQCSFTDGFVFLLKEVGSSSYENLAVIPNTNIAVKVNTVRGTGTICPAQNEQYFDAFNGNEHPTNFNGQTKVLTAKSAVIPGRPYHIKLVIADEGNYRYDSAIFLKGSSFSVGVDLGSDRVFANNNPICPTESLTLNGTAPGALSYQWNFNTNPIPGETNATLTFNPPFTSAQDGTYSLTTTYSPTCTTVADIDLEFAPDLVINQDTYFYCDADAAQDGITTVTLSDIVPTLFTNLPLGFQVSFYSSAASTTPLSDSFLLTTPFQQIIYAKITNSSCYAPIPVTININVFTNTIADEELGMCNNDPITLTADPGYAFYTWSTGETTQLIQVATPAVYTVTIENADGCTKIKTFTVIGSEIATIDDIIVNDFNGDNSVEIIVSGTGNYEYSINGIQYQDSAVFNDLNGLVYTAYVRDKNGCGEVSREFYLIQIPKFFTPNGDGYNDYWNIKDGNPLAQNAGALIYIFDRFGKLLKQISAEGLGWDGIYNGKLMPADDYWYRIQLPDNRTHNGHFTLKR
ncbi:MAG: T9SS type B sorting domain-containing protein [Flavobacterium sp. JAD_PAG50586_2]|nr:MAG: T9SS type B sorting domain-containing protein [Flavobacterium sp. JAD_PAG50586_2]